MVGKVEQQLHKAMDDSIPWSRPGPKPQSWWTPEITTLKKKLTEIQRIARNDVPDEVNKDVVKVATRQWKKAICEAQWKFCEEKLHQIS